MRYDNSAEQPGESPGVTTGFSKYSRSLIISWKQFFLFTFVVKKVIDYISTYPLMSTVVVNTFDI